MTTTPKPPQTTAPAYQDGKADAALGYSPRNREPIYLNGYLDGIRDGILQGTYILQIRWLSPAYLSGGYDSPE